MIAAIAGRAWTGPCMALLIAATFRNAAGAGVVHQNSSDHLRAQREKVKAVFTANASRPLQLEIRLIGQGRGFQGLAGRTTPEVAPGNPPQLGVDGSHQPAYRLFIALAPGGDPCADVLATLVAHAMAILPKKSLAPGVLFAAG